MINEIINIQPLIPPVQYNEPQIPEIYAADAPVDELVRVVIALEQYSVSGKVLVGGAVNINDGDDFGRTTKKQFTSVTMKAIIYSTLFFLFVLSPYLAHSQKEIIYDFKARKFDTNSKHEDIKYGDYYYVTVKGINTYCYDVIIESESHIDTTKYVLPSITSLNIETISGLLSNFPSLALDDVVQLGTSGPIVAVKFNDEYNYELYHSGSFLAPTAKKFRDFISQNRFRKLSRSEKLEDLMDNENDILKALDEQLQPLVKATETWQNLAENFTYTNLQTSFDLTTFFSAQPNLEDIESLIKTVETNKLKYQLSVVGFSKELEKEKFKLRHAQILKSYDQALLMELKTLKKAVGVDNVNALIGNIAKRRVNYESSILSKLQQKVLSLPNSIQTELSKIEELERKMTSPESESADFSSHTHSMASTELLKAFTDGRTATQALVKDILDKLIAYQMEMNRILQRMKPGKEIMAANKERETAYNLLSDEANKNIENLSTKNWQALDSRLRAISANTKFELTSNVFEFYGDQGWFKVTFTPSRCPEKPKLNTFVYSFPKKKRSRFATTYSFYGSKLYDDVYSIKSELRPDPMSGEVYTVFRAVDEENEKFEFGNGVTMDFKINKKNKLNLSLAVGPAISFTRNVRLRLLTGFNAAFGKGKHRFAIGTGMISGYVNRVSNAVDINAEFEVKPERVTVSKLDASVYLSVGYQFRLN